ncbi:hypothetical protein LOK46_13930 [Methylobacterium sp. NMS14P]|nr:hypothetical protein [Methylobacterium sp. NMS14P]WCS27873.1 hypothetical protein LOK46_13930 [Methylobacterium sp. NMS14P]
MRYRTLIASVPLAALLSGPAHAQAPTTAPSAPPSSSGVVAPQSGSTGTPGAVTGSPTGQPADTRSNSSSAAGNANQPERPAPQGGGGGGSSR